MRNKLTYICALATITSVATAQQTQENQQGFLARMRANSANNREIAQPAQSPQGYRPGVTFPQAAQQQPQQQPPRQATPVPFGYPPLQGAPYNMAPGAAPAQARPTATPAGSSSSSSTSSRRNNEDEKEESSSRSRSGSRSSNDEDKSDSSKKSSSESSSKSSKSSSDEKKSESAAAEKKAETPSSSKSESGASSALEKIVKKVESGSKSDEKAEETPAVKKLTEEEKEAAKARQKALEQVDKATTVVAEFLKLANNGYYSKANDKLAPSIKKYFESEIAAVNGTEKTVLDELTHNGNINMVTYVNTTVRGEGAVVEAELGYQDGTTQRRTFDLIKMDEDWKIVLAVTKEDVAAHTNAAPAAPAPTPAPAPAQGGVQVTPAAPNASMPAAPQQPQAANTPAAVPTAEQAAAAAAGPLVVAPAADANTSAPQQ